MTVENNRFYGSRIARQRKRGGLPQSVNLPGVDFSSASIVHPPSRSRRSISRNPSSQVICASLPAIAHSPGELGAWSLLAPALVIVRNEDVPPLSSTSFQRPTKAELSAAC